MVRARDGSTYRYVFKPHNKFHASIDSSVAIRDSASGLVAYRYEVHNDAASQQAIAFFLVAPGVPTRIELKDRTAPVGWSTLGGFYTTQAPIAPGQSGVMTGQVESLPGVVTVKLDIQSDLDWQPPDELTDQQRGELDQLSGVLVQLRALGPFFPVERFDVPVRARIVDVARHYASAYSADRLVGADRLALASTHRPESSQEVRAALAEMAAIASSSQKTEWGQAVSSGLRACVKILTAAADRQGL